MNPMVQPLSLRCEYRENPLGIDVAAPRFSWVLQDGTRGQRQTAYQVLVASSLAGLEAGHADRWDSGKVKSGRSVNVEYAGSALRSSERCHWKVRIWDMNGEQSADSEAAWFELGLLRPEDWQTAWIGYTGGKSGESLLVRRSFRIDKPVARARVYISGLGYYELRINGRKMGDHVLDPGWTDYSRTVLYVTYDIGEHLRRGDNAVGIMLGHGWHGSPRLRLQLLVEYGDGGRDVLWPHEAGWSVAGSPIVRDSVHDGEEYDARLEKPGWDTPEYRSRVFEWLPAQRVAAPGGAMKAQMAEPIKVVDRLTPVALGNPKPGIFVYDLGQNIAGWCVFKVSGPAGTVVSLRFAELLHEDGTVNQENLRTARARILYTLNGSAVETYEPRFTYFGFRYVQVEGFPGTPRIEHLTGCVLRNAVRQGGSFRCSNELLNRIQQNIVWTEGNNLHWVPTDCPQRDERQGWLNDLTVRIEEALYNFHLPALLWKFLRDVRETQDSASGAVADTAPHLWGTVPADSTAISYVLLPWYMYLHYGDRRVLEEYYGSIKGWADYLYSRTDKEIVDYCWYGDWCSPVGESWPADKPGLPPDSPGAVTVIGSYSATTPGMLMGTAHLIWASRTMASIARVLGKKREAAMYESRSARITEAFNRKFLHTESGRYASGSQCSNAFPLFLDVVPPATRAAVLDNLVRDVVESHKGHLSTGNHGTKFLMEVLTELGRGDVAYGIATQTTYPSWGYMISMGATTNWERWEYMTGPGMNSHDHPCLGNVSAWFYKKLAGINVDPSGPGWEKVMVKPHLLGDLRSVDASVETVRGTVAVSWRRLQRSVRMSVTVPANSRAAIGVPTLGLAGLEITEGGTAVWKDGRYVPGARGIDSARHEGSWVFFETGSGTYEFAAGV